MGSRGWIYGVPRHVGVSARLLGACALAGCALATAVLLLLAPVAGAGYGGQMRVLMTTASLRRDHRLQHGYRVLARELRSKPSRARAAVVGGSQIAIEQAPWQVEVEAFTTVMVAGKRVLVVLYCGGSILDSTHVLTAGHCVFNPETRARIPADQIVVLAGDSDFLERVPTDQEVLASEVRTHPYFSYNPEAKLPTPDDVAMLALGESLAFDTAVEPIGLASTGSTPGEGRAVRLNGSGEEGYSPEELNGRLYSLDMTMDFSYECGGEADAVFLCASTPTGSLCLGDSGSGLTLPGSPTTLIGVADTVQVIGGEPCRDGARGGFANVAAPEIRDFIEGNEAPPRAPRGGGTLLHGEPYVGGMRPGDSLTCEPGAWSNAPIFTYAFIDSASGQILQQGPSSTYVLTAADVGDRILCEVQAANAGGTAVVRTEALPPVEEGFEKATEGLKKIVEAHEREAREKKEREEAEQKPLAIPTLNAPLGVSAGSGGGLSARGGVAGIKTSHVPTRAQLLAKALKQCQKQPKHKRAKCVALARKRYGPKARGKK